MYADYLVCPNKYVNIDRKQWNYFSDEHLFDDDDVHIVFNRTLTNSLPTLTHIGDQNDVDVLIHESTFEIDLKMYMSNRTSPSNKNPTQLETNINRNITSSWQ
ncbi:unnamed protein product [Rotaria sp. Silwood1]|nr:unnamed protein product [Rotaria sp. Silwood1]